MKKDMIFYEIWEDDFVVDEEDYMPTEIKIRLSVEENDIREVKEAMYKAYENWLYEECENSILLDEETTIDDLTVTPIEDYIFEWLDKLGFQYEKKEIEEITMKIFANISGLKEVCCELTGEVLSLSEIENITKKVYPGLTYMRNFTHENIEYMGFHDEKLNNYYFIETRKKV